MHKRRVTLPQGDHAQVRDVTETAQVLGVGPGSVRKMIKAGELRCVRVGRRVLIPHAEVERFLPGREHRSAGAAMSTKDAPATLDGASHVMLALRGGGTMERLRVGEGDDCVHVARPFRVVLALDRGVAA